MEKLKAIFAKIDLKTDSEVKGLSGTSQRWTVGKPGDAVSGALYLPKDVILPIEITIGFLAGSREHEVNKEESKNVSNR
jgi:hypothetical protein